MTGPRVAVEIHALVFRRDVLDFCERYDDQPRTHATDPDLELVRPLRTRQEADAFHRADLAERRLDEKAFATPQLQIALVFHGVAELDRP
jgi:hypothetical protein